MATQVPASLKPADINRFAHRATQLETAEPVIAYWCNYWIVNQILSKRLHDADQEALVYTTNMMDKLEKFKNENPTNDAVTDDIAGKAYVEQFGLKTFSRADNAVRANKATIQTADTFQAAATFLDLLSIWGNLEPEIAAKAKYAKFHALRIVKALKSREDPNLSNPTPEPQPEEILPALDPNDAEVRALEGGSTKSRQPSVVEIPDEAHMIQRGLAQRSALDESLHPSRDTSLPPSSTKQRQPSVIDVPDEAHKLQANLARISSKDESLHPSRAPSAPSSPKRGVSPLAQDPSAFYTSGDNHAHQPSQPGDTSPVSPEPRRSSVGGNYFPQVPAASSSHPTQTDTDAPGGDDGGTALDLPSAPTEYTSSNNMTSSLPEPPTTFAQPPPPRAVDTFLPPPLPGQPALSNIPPNLLPTAPVHTKPEIPPQLRPTVSNQASVPSTRTTQPARAPVHYAPPPPPPPPPSQPVKVDEEAVLKAQKHARWAISALNFEDVPTAIREFQAALRTLGA